MFRKLMILLTMSGLVSRIAYADDKPISADDPIALALKKAKDEYTVANGKANEKLLAAFADEKRKLEENTKLKVEQQIKAVKQIEEEQKAFEADNAKLPSSPVMKSALSEYRLAMKRARDNCEKAFDKAADDLRKPPRKDLSSAAAVLEEKKLFFAGPTEAINIKKGDIWEGVKTWTKDRPGYKHQVRVEITEVDGQKFKGKFSWGDTPDRPPVDKIRPITGEFSNGKIEWSGDGIQLAKYSGTIRKGALDGTCDNGIISLKLKTPK